MEEGIYWVLQDLHGVSIFVNYWGGGVDVEGLAFKMKWLWERDLKKIRSNSTTIHVNGA